MEITLEKLKKLKACEDLIKYFQANHVQEAKLENALKKLKNDKTTTGYICCLFENFKLSGVAEYWYSNGNLGYRGNYQNGKLIS